METWRKKIIMRESMIWLKRENTIIQQRNEKLTLFAPPLQTLLKEGLHLRSYYWVSEEMVKTDAEVRINNYKIMDTLKIYSQR